MFDHLGVGAGVFGPMIAFPIFDASFWFVTADLDSDGTQDLAALPSTTPGDGIILMTNMQPDPVNITPYGTGTAGREGIQGMLTNGPPVNGTPGFGFTTTNAPPRSLGLLFITDAPSMVGVDPFGIGADFHLDFFAATTIYLFDIRSGPHGTANAVTGIPLDPALVGLDFYAQSLWVWTAADAYFSPPVGASTSRAIKLTIL
jgi:hypothetical protein